MSFDADAYDRFMGRFSVPLAARFADLVDLRPGARVLDVGCGPGALTAVLVERVGPDAVAAIDPTESYVAAARARLPGVDVRAGTAERIPHPDGAFDLTLAQLVVHHMADPVAGLTEMARVTRPGGQVAACVWDNAGGSGPLSSFWRAARELDTAADDGSGMAGAREGHLAELFATAGLRQVEPSTLNVSVRFATYADWWEPYALGVGPTGAYLARLDAAHRDALHRRCEELLPPAPLEIHASAWCVRAQA